MLNKSMEVIWKAGITEDENLFTGVLYNIYFPPPNFCWDLLCSDEPMMDNPLLHDNNAERRVKEFLDYARMAAEPYRTNNVAITTGMDFHYQVCTMPTWAAGARQARGGRAAGVWGSRGG
jgi:lysosomal alpha-mannosidase